MENQHSRRSVSFDRVQEICQALNEAGENWPEVARGINEIGAPIRGDDVRRDRIFVLYDVTRPDMDGAEFRYPSVLYRTEVGDWHATGWSDASLRQVFRPLGIHYDPDAGVHRINDSTVDQEV